jgi:lysyl-tRNA synthetase class 2
VKKRLEARSRVVDAFRDFLTDRGFIEVETPTLQPVYGGGLARPFITRHNVLDADFYLRISDEMYLKRLIVGGFEKVFEITKVFRNEGVDHDHNPEFTMFEAQIAFKDYAYGMDLVEEIIEYTALQVLGTTKFTYQGVAMDVRRPWSRMKVVEAVKKFAGVDPLSWKTVTEAKAAIQKMDIPEAKFKELKKLKSVGEHIAFAFEEVVEPHLIEPTIIYDYPIEISPLAKKCEDPRFTQRFEMFAFGSELGNNYSELNDPVDLKKRFVDEKKREKAGFAEAHQTDEDYLEAIEHGFPPTCGLGIGVDRIVMLLTDAKSIKEVIPFPTLRPQK